MRSQALGMSDYIIWDAVINHIINKFSLLYELFTPITFHDSNFQKIIIID